jgi:hypothetical protein
MGCPPAKPAPSKQPHQTLMRLLGREYVGGVGEAKALATVTRDSDNRPAMALCDKPSATLWRLISAQSFIVIIHPICRGWSTFQKAFLVQFSASVDRRTRAGTTYLVSDYSGPLLRVASLDGDSASHHFLIRGPAVWFDALQQQKRIRLRDLL